MCNGKISTQYNDQISTQYNDQISTCAMVK